jgi:hypothetical protein
VFLDVVILTLVVGPLPISVFKCHVFGAADEDILHQGRSGWGHGARKGRRLTHHLESREEPNGEGESGPLSRFGFHI